jgi:cobyrinic acid a,c-diamide synthase
MVGIFPARARMQARLAKLGYVEVETDSGVARGHEYRYSTVNELPAKAYRVHAAAGSYVHLHFLSCPRFAEEFVDRCEKWRIR